MTLLSLLLTVSHIPHSKLQMYTFVRYIKMCYYVFCRSFTLARAAAVAARQHVLGGWIDRRPYVAWRLLFVFSVRMSLVVWTVPLHSMILRSLPPFLFFLTEKKNSCS